jgi:hypothetical protein
MNGKKWLVGLLAVAAAVWVGAQEAKPLVSPTIQDAIVATRGQIQADRQAVVAANLGLTEAEGKTFWPLYRDYRTDMAKLGDRLSDLIVDYAKNYDTLTDEQAKKMVTEFLAIQKDEVSTKQAWVPKFEKVLPAKKVARFFQIENKLDLLVRLAIAQDVPLVQ